MKVQAAALTALAITTHAIRLNPRTISPRVVSIDIARTPSNSESIPKRDRARLNRRQNNVVEQEIDNEQSLYFANVTLGTPGQQIRLHLDTGSSDLWTNVQASDLCQSNQGQACSGGTYDSGSSSTFTILNADFNISYVDGTAAVGDYVTDTLQFGGVTLPDFQFGTGQQSSSSEGVLGIGYAINEVVVNRAGGSPYPNLPVALVNGGHINSNAYSLYLNDLDSSTGAILFGGVNSAHYSGTLETVPVIQTYGSYFELVIALTGLTVNGASLSSENLPAAVLLDSGSTLTYLPDDMVVEIYNDVQAVYESQVGAAYASCDQASSSKSIDFTFSGKTISVPYSELFLDAGSVNGQPLTFQNGDRACLFGIAPASAGITVLGDTFLRSAYTVYDLANNEISLAQATFDSISEDIQEIAASGDNSVPGATPVSNPVTAVAAGTGGARLGGGATAAVTGLSDSNAAVSKSGLGSLSLAIAIAALTVCIAGS